MVRLVKDKDGVVKGVLLENKGRIIDSPERINLPRGRFKAVYRSSFCVHIIASIRVLIKQRSTIHASLRYG